MCVISEKLPPLKRTQRKVSTADFFHLHPVFSLEEANQGLKPPGGRAGTRERLRYHLDTGRLKLVGNGLYAVVPPGSKPEAVRVDPLLAAAAARPDAVFCFHSALELLGVAQSVWNECTVTTERRRRPLELGPGRVRFLQPPEPMREEGGRQLGTRRIERSGRILVTTGPERTLVEGLRRPQLAGGLEELVLSAGALPTLDLRLLERILARYAIANLWAATGWFLERHQGALRVPAKVLARWEREVPASPQYLERGRRGGTLARRWNLILPAALERLGGPDER